MLVDKVHTDTIEVWKAEILRKEYVNEVLDKIRAEIEEIPKKYPMTMDYESGLKEALAIIDKYRQEG